MKLSLNEKLRYPITFRQKERLELKQRERCAICRYKPSFDSYALAVDHDHKTGFVRGLLCGNCNLGLGNFKDNPELLKKAIIYLANNYQTIIETATETFLSERSTKDLDPISE